MGSPLDFFTSSISIGSMDLSWDCVLDVDIEREKARQNALYAGALSLTRPTEVSKIELGIGEKGERGCRRISHSTEERALRRPGGQTLMTSQGEGQSSIYKFWGCSVQR